MKKSNKIILILTVISVSLALAVTLFFLNSLPSKESTTFEATLSQYYIKDPIVVNQMQCKDTDKFITSGSKQFAAYYSGENRVRASIANDDTELYLVANCYCSIDINEAKIGVIYFTYTNYKLKTITTLTLRSNQQYGYDMNMTIKEFLDLLSNIDTDYIDEIMTTAEALPGVED